MFPLGKSWPASTRAPRLRTMQERPIARTPTKTKVGRICVVRLDCFPHISHTCKKRWPLIFTLPYINPSTAGNPNFPSYIYPSPYPSLTVCLVPFPPPFSSSPSRHLAQRQWEAAFPKHLPHSTPATQKTPLRYPVFGFIYSSHTQHHCATSRLSTLNIESIQTPAVPMAQDRVPMRLYL